MLFRSVDGHFSHDLKDLANAISPRQKRIDCTSLRLAFVVVLGLLKRPLLYYGRDYKKRKEAVNVGF